MNAWIRFDQHCRVGFDFGRCWRNMAVGATWRPCVFWHAAWQYGQSPRPWWPTSENPCGPICWRTCVPIDGPTCAPTCEPTDGMTCGRSLHLAPWHRPFLPSGQTLRASVRLPVLLKVSAPRQALARAWRRQPSMGGQPGRVRASGWLRPLKRWPAARQTEGTST